MSINRFADHTKAKAKLKAIFARSDKVFAIHYSCESFYNQDDPRSPRIATIACRNFDTNQSTSFSLHLVAELNGVPFDDIDRQYDLLERKMLDQFAEFLKDRRDATWVHWNMREPSYGFQAIEHRHRVLQGEPEVVSDDRKFDLSALFNSIYGENYIPHPHLINIVKKNNLTQLDFLTGAEEADAFRDKRYLDLHRSTLRKVGLIYNLAKRAFDETLVTDSSWMDIFGSSIEAWLARILHHPVYHIVAIVSVVITVIVGIPTILSWWLGSGP